MNADQGEVWGTGVTNAAARSKWDSWSVTGYKRMRFFQCCFCLCCIDSWYWDMNVTCVHLNLRPSFLQGLCDRNLPGISTPCQPTHAKLQGRLQDLHWCRAVYQDRRWSLARPWRRVRIIPCVFATLFCWNSCLLSYFSGHSPFILSLRMRL